jgi:hypothetical protein
VKVLVVLVGLAVVAATVFVVLVLFVVLAPVRMSGPGPG